MRVRLTLAQVTALIDKAELITEFNPGKSIGIGEGEKEEGIPPARALAEAIMILKTAVQREVDATESRLDNMVRELNEHGYTEITAELDKVKFQMVRQNNKTEDKYFDEDGRIKPKGLL